MPTPIAASNIAAQAFRAMELGPISSFADESDQASDAAEQYPVALKGILETADWSFASRLASLAPADPPADDAAFQTDDDLPGLFVLPADCVTLREVRPNTVRWRLDQGYLRASQTTALTIRYTRLVENEAQLPAAVQTAVAYRLATLLAPRWVNSRTKRQDLKQDATDLQKEAERTDAPMASGTPHSGTGESYVDWVSEATW